MGNLGEKHRDVLRRSESIELVPADEPLVEELVNRGMLTTDDARLTAKGCAYMAGYHMDVSAPLARLGVRQVSPVGRRHSLCDTLDAACSIHGNPHADKRVPE